MTTNKVYIRTIDGVFEVPAIFDKETGNVDYDAYAPMFGFVLKYSFYIDELFNRVICINKNHYKIMTMYQFGKLSRSEIAKSIDKKGVRYLGCCWTRKGLEYVAEYEKGEWRNVRRT